MGIEILGNNVVLNKESLILQNKQEYLSKPS